MKRRGKGKIRKEAGKWAEKKKRRNGKGKRKGKERGESKSEKVEREKGNASLAVCCPRRQRLP